MKIRIAYIQLLPEKYSILSDPNVRDVIGGEFVHW